MDDMNSMLNSVLSDPESMKQIKELADMLKSDDADSAAPDGEQSGGMDMSALTGMLGALSGGTSSAGTSAGGIDFEMITQLGKVISAVGGEDKNRALLMALRPHVSADKQERIDKAVKLLRLYAVIMTLKDSGMLGKLDKLF